MQDNDKAESELRDEAYYLAGLAHEDKSRRQGYCMKKIVNT